MSTVFNFTFVPWFRSVAPYIHMHRGKTFVVGVAGEAIAAGKLHNIVQDLALIQSMGVKIVLVHGFRPQVNEQLAAKGHTPRYSHGMRITDSVALDCAQEAAGQLPGPAQHAHGRLDRARDFGQLHHRPPGGHRGRGGFHALGTGAQGRCGGHHAHPGHGGDGAALAFWLALILALVSSLCGMPFVGHGRPVITSDHLRLPSSGNFLPFIPDLLPSGRFRFLPTLT